MEHYLLRPAGSNVLLLGNEIIARAALESGICVATAYPGTPSTEIVEVLASVAKKSGIYVEWSVNEKVAFETAYAAAISGVRALTSMKHVGLNVAADILMSSSYSGVNEGFVIVSADDPGQHSSQNEQDNRWYGLLSHIPVIEPSSPRDAYYLTREAFELSNRYKHPVMLRSTTRISHTRQSVIYDRDIPLNKKCKGFFEKNPERWVLVPANARKQKSRMMSTWRAIRENEGREPFVKIFNPGMRKAIIASGIAFSHVYEALDYMDQLDKVTLIKVNMPVPLPPDPILKALRDSEEVLVVEELDPVVEYQVKSIVNEAGLVVRVHGKDLIPGDSELSIDAIYTPLAVFLGIEAKTPWSGIGEVTTDPPIPPRPPVLCAGCPHRCTFYVVKTALNKAGLRNPVFTGDIGCYTLGYQKPFETQSTSFEMGGSIGIAHGLSKVIDEPIIAVIGDSTFFHAGLPPALNIVYNKGHAVILVLDNMTTAMTGHQPHPGTGITAMSEATIRALPEKVLESMGYRVIVINPLRVKESINELAGFLELYKRGENVAIVSRMKCALEVLRDARRKGIVLPVYSVLGERCRACMACVKLTACPAMVLDKGSGKPFIIQSLCAGCGLCASICPFHAIVVTNKPSENWEVIWHEA
ncbi:MAG: indolepyruvate ferredoxin oxidoreductase subunit alpha [Desulfurococcaceae archaeon]